MKNPVAIGFNNEHIIFPYILFLVLIGMYLTLRMKFPQFRFLFLAIKIFSGNMDEKGLKGQLVHSQAFFAGFSSSFIIGSIIGTGFAVMTGGFGTLVWIWILTFLFMPIRLVAPALAIKFRTKLPSGRYLSGPMYFIEKALKARWLAVAFAVGSIFTVLSLGVAVPVVSIMYITEGAFGLGGMLTGFMLTIAVIFIILGGIRRIGRVAGYIVPSGLALFVASYFSFLGEGLQSLTGFFSFVFADFSASLQSGDIRPLLEGAGIYFLAGETGLGKSSGISGVVRTDYSAKHGLTAMLAGIVGIFLSILVAFALYSYHSASFIEQRDLVSWMFTRASGPAGQLFFLSIIMIAIVAVAGWFYTGEQSAYYILGEKFANFFRIFFFITMLAVAHFYIENRDWMIGLSYRAGLTAGLLTAIPVLVSLVLLFRSANTDLKRYISTKGVRYEFFKDIYLLLLTVLPKNLISKLFGVFSGLRLPRFMMVPILRAFAGMYKINLNEAELDIIEYNSLNQFFTRALKAGARIIDSARNAVVAPTDSKITNFGEIKKNIMIQAKGINYNLNELLGTDRYLDDFMDGKFITFYLSPTDYHRIHSPFSGKVLGYYYEPGKLFPVNELAVVGVKALFPKNERLITFLQTEYGKIAVIKVGASNVGRIRVTYDDKIVTNSWVRFRKEVVYEDRDIRLEKGSELGRFEMGSTVILLFEKNTFEFNELDLNSKIQYGTTIGHFKKGANA